MENKTSEFPEVPLDFGDIMGLSIKRYHRAFLATVVFIVFMSIAQGVDIYLHRYFTSSFMHWLIFIVTGIVYLFFASAGFYQTHATFLGKASDPGKTLQLLLPRIPKVIALVAILFGGLLLWHYLVYHFGGEWIGHPKAHPGRLALLMFVFYFLPSLVALGFFAYTVPLMVLDNPSLLAVWGIAQRLVGDRWIRGFALYLGFLIIVAVVWPYSLHAHFFMRYHLLVLFIFVMYCVLLPVYFNMAVLLIHDFKRLRKMDV